VCRLLNATFPEREMKKQVLAEHCDRSEAVGKLRACVLGQLDAILDLPVRQQSQRAVLLKSLESIIKTVGNYCLKSYELHGLLVIAPFKTELTCSRKMQGLSMQHNLKAKAGAFDSFDGAKTTN